MNKSDRRELFDALEELRRCYPKWRFGQLIANIAEWGDESVWDIKDDQLLEIAKEHLVSLSQHDQIART